MTTQTQRYAYDTATTVQIVAHWCDGCGIAYGLPQGFIEARRGDQQSWTCPNGCVRHFPKPTGPTAAEKKAARLERELDAARTLAQRESRRRTQAEASARTADYKARAAKGQLTRTRKRIAAGVCPCCQRTFTNLARHIAGQHPEFPETER